MRDVAGFSIVPNSNEVSAVQVCGVLFDQVRVNQSFGLKATVCASLPLVLERGGKK